MNYKTKYLKYKTKYLKLKNMMSGGLLPNENPPTLHVPTPYIPPPVRRPNPPDAPKKEHPHMSRDYIPPRQDHTVRNLFPQ